jgi:hypothetical protein
VPKHFEREQDQALVVTDCEKHASSAVPELFRVIADQAAQIVSRFAPSVIDCGLDCSAGAIVSCVKVVSGHDALPARGIHGLKQAGV